MYSPAEAALEVAEGGAEFNWDPEAAEGPGDEEDTGAAEKPGKLRGAENSELRASGPVVAEEAEAGNVGSGETLGFVPPLELGMDECAEVEPLPDPWANFRASVSY
ncbi:MAG: hypothetical protein P4L69_23525 [Desulfosporosinus sp.]|nr:hypothetical protein [Desulfosporosinus sp.]